MTKKSSNIYFIYLERRRGRGWWEAYDASIKERSTKRPVSIAPAYPDEEHPSKPSLQKGIFTNNIENDSTKRGSAKQGRESTGNRKNKTDKIKYKRLF